jgi:heme-degrading monooxygenase HmoA
MQIAQLNVARMLAPLDDPVMADFVAGLAPVNAAADAAPGFVWRLADETGTGATSIRIDEDDLLIVNMSVWESPEDLAAFVHRQRDHAAALRRRRDWFERVETPMVVLWWVRDGHRPTVDEAAARLEHLRANGPTPHAFPFRLPVPTPV